MFGTQPHALRRHHPNRLAVGCRTRGRRCLRTGPAPALRSQCGVCRSQDAFQLGALRIRQRLRVMLFQDALRLLAGGFDRIAVTAPVVVDVYDLRKWELAEVLGKLGLMEQ